VTRGQPNPPQDGYEVRPHMVAGVVAIYYLPRPGAVGEMVFTCNEMTLPALGEAIAKYMYRRRSEEREAPPQIRLVREDEG
jgi:hypothetical protein